jgi:hypothetical protein
MFPRAIILVLVSVSLAAADDVNPTAEGHLFGIRSLGMSGAVVGSGLGAHALFHNPAGVVGRLKTEIAAGLLQLSLDRATSWIGAVYPSKKWCLSLAWSSAGVTDVPLRSEDGTLLGHDSWRNHRIGIGYSRMLDFLTFVGAEVHYLRNEIPEQAGNGLGVDFGVVRLILPPLLSVGCAVNDLTSFIHYDDSDRTEMIRPKVTGAVVIGLAEGKIRFEWDLSNRVGGHDWRHVIGLELRANENIVLWAGYGEGGVSAGFGVSTGPVAVGFSGVPDELSNDPGRGVEVRWRR